MDPPQEDLPVETIIIVACVCGGVVVILTIILIVLCCRRHQNQKKYQNAQAGHMSPVPVTKTNGHVNVEAGRAINNPPVDQPDTENPPTRNVYPPERPKHVPNVNYAPYSQKVPNNNHMLHHPHHHHQQQQQQQYPHDAHRWSHPNGPSVPDYPPPSYENNVNEYKENGVPGESQYTGPQRVKRKAPGDPGYLQAPGNNLPLHGNLKDSSGDSGVSAPDPVIKPRKVIHEVVV